ncbi:MAG: hypothetical protein ACK4YP_09380 [Myxococcota bacterium]
MFLLLATALAADTVTLTYTPGAPGPPALRCVGERERRAGPQVAKNRLEVRAVPRAEKVGATWAIGTASIEVVAASADPPPPPGAPSLEALLARADELTPDMLLDDQGRWVGVEAVSPEVQDAALTALLTAANLPAALVDRLKAAVLPTLGPDAVTARLRESWYVHTGHWLGRTLPVGRSEIGEAKAGDPLAAGTTMTWSATRRVACGGGGGGPTDCVELRLDARSPAEAVTAQAASLVTGVAHAIGVPPDQIRVEGASLTTVWTLVVDPKTLTAWSTERRRVTDAQMSVGGQPIAGGTTDVFRCVAE